MIVYDVISKICKHQQPNIYSRNKSLIWYSNMSSTVTRFPPCTKIAVVSFSFFHLYFDQNWQILPAMMKILYDQTSMSSVQNSSCLLYIHRGFYYLVV